ncbi:MAG TPA: VWA domain-containing protein, partial [Vicinamibacteria bacterium]
MSPPTFGREVEVVRVDVVVQDGSGKPVSGLRKEDFSLLDEGQVQSIEAFEAVDRPVPPVAAAGAPRPRLATNAAAAPTADGARACIVVVDTLNLSPASAARAKAAVALFLDEGVREGDRVTLIDTGGAAWWNTRMPEGRADLLTILKGLAGRRIRTDAREAITDFEAMRIFVYDDSQVGERVRRRFETYGVTSRVESERERERRQTYMPGIQDPYVARRAAEEYLKVKSRTRATFTALERALLPLARTRERKTLLLVSDGFIFDPQEEGFKAVTEAARRANTVLYFLDARGLLAPGFYSAQFGALPGSSSDYGAVLSDSSQDAEGAEVLSRQTGGLAIRNTNDLSDGVKRIAQEARSYYLLGYSPNVPRDGKFRKLEVKVQGRGLRVRYRAGYYAPSSTPAPGTRADGKDPVFQEALDGAVFREEVPLRMTSYVLGDATAGKAKVLIAADGEVSKLGFEEKEGQLLGTLDVLLVVAQRETGEFSRYDQKVDLARKVGAVSGLAWYSFVREFELLPGGYQAKIVVRDPRSGRVGSVAYEFEVPALGGFRVSTPVLTDTLQQEGAAIGPVLVARRTFPNSRPLYCRFDVYGMSRDKDGQPRVSASHVLRRPDGTVLGRSAPTPILPTSLGTVARMLQVPLDVDPGEYELVLN